MTDSHEDGSFSIFQTAAKDSNGNISMATNLVDSRSRNSYFFLGFSMHVISSAIFSGRRIILPIGERSRLSDVMKERLQAPAPPEPLSPVFAIATVKKNGFA